MNAKINVYDIDGNVRAQLDNIEYSGAYMGECYIQSTLKSPMPIDFAIGDTLTYRGDVFTLNYVPTCKKQSLSGAYGEAFVYENIKFDSYSDELVRCDFKDVVTDDNQIHWTGMTTFSFYAESVRDLAKRIQANLDFTFGKDLWSVTVDDSFTKTKEQSISADNNTVWEALSWCYDKFKANFIIRGRKIIIGAPGTSLGKTFKYGFGNGLKSLERSADSSQKIVTRLRAYGNTTNIPTSYYKYLCCFVKTKFSEFRQPGDGTQSFHPLSACMNDSLVYTDAWYDASKESSEMQHDSPYITLYYDDGNKSTCFYPAKATSSEEGYNVRWVTKDAVFAAWALTHKDGELMVRGGCGINMNKALLNHPDEVNSELYPNNMAVTRLMLPGFPTEKGERELADGYKLVYTNSDCYIESKNIGKYGVREGSVYIDGTDNDSTDEDIFPSLEDMTAKDLEAAGIIVSLASGDNGNLDELAWAQEMTDDGDATDSTLSGSVCKVKAKDMGFNPKDYVIGGTTAQIYMKSGMCAGRTFDISNCAKSVEDGVTYYEITLNRESDELGYYYPNKNFQIKAGDSFVLLGIEMPDVYVKAASERLLTEALIYLKDNDDAQFTYKPTPDPLYWKRDYDTQKALGKTSLLEAIHEGDLFDFDDVEDMKIMGSLFISSLTIRDGVGMDCPEIDIELEEKHSVGTITKMQSQISTAILNSGGGSGGGMTAQQVQNLIAYSQKYLKRTEDDSAEGLITFGNGLSSASSKKKGALTDTAADGIVEDIIPETTTE